MKIKIWKRSRSKRRIDSRILILCSVLGLILSVSPAALAADGNRLAYLD
jgi:hypothetical protein